MAVAGVFAQTPAPTQTIAGAADKEFLTKHAATGKTYKYGVDGQILCPQDPATPCMTVSKELMLASAKAIEEARMKKQKMDAKMRTARFYWTREAQLLLQMEKYEDEKKMIGKSGFLPKDAQKTLKKEADEKLEKVKLQMKAVKKEYLLRTTPKTTPKPKLAAPAVPQPKGPAGAPVGPPAGPKPVPKPKTKKEGELEEILKLFSEDLSSNASSTKVWAIILCFF